MSKKERNLNLIVLRPLYNQLTIIIFCESLSLVSSLFFRWFKIEGVGLRQVLPSPKIKHHLEVLILQELLVEDSGIYVCIMNNTAGAERIEVNLTVRSWLDTLVTPSHQTIGKKNENLY